MVDGLDDSGQGQGAGASGVRRTTAEDDVHVRNGTNLVSVLDGTLRCVELAGTLAYSENELLEKWARGSKILDIFEGTNRFSS